MLDQTYAQKFEIEYLVPMGTSDAVQITTTSGKTIILHSLAYVLLNDGMMEQVSNLTPGVPLAGVGRVKGMKVVGNRHLMHNESQRRVQTVNGFKVALWKRGVRYE